MWKKLASGNGSEINGMVSGKQVYSAFAILAMLVAVGGIISSLISPITAHMVSLEQRIDKNDAVDENSLNDRLGVHSKIATIETKFAEIETQFRNLDERTKRMEDSMRREFETVQAFDNSSSSDRQGIRTKLAELETKNAEIETQFRYSKSATDQLFAAASHNLDQVERAFSGRFDIVTSMINQLGVFVPRGPTTVPLRGVPRPDASEKAPNS